MICVALYSLIAFKLRLSQFQSNVSHVRCNTHAKPIVAVSIYLKTIFFLENKYLKTENATVCALSISRECIAFGYSYATFDVELLVL